MKTYTYYWDYDTENEFPMCLGERMHCNTDVVAVSYTVEQGKIVLYSVEDEEGVNILSTLEKWGHTDFLKRMAESHQMKLSVKQMYNNYPHLAKTPTLEEKVEMLKIK